MVNKRNQISKLLVVLIMGVVMCVPELSYAQAQKPTKPEPVELARLSLIQELELSRIGAAMADTNRELVAVADRRGVVISAMTLHYGDGKDIILLGRRTSQSLEHTFLACIGAPREV